MTRVGFYPGTFDPIHNGHTDVIGRAVKLVDKLVIGVAINAGKGPLFSLEERVAIVEEAVEQLKRADPDNAAQIRAIQHTIHVAESIQYWLADAIQAGLNAQQELHDQEGA